jgi:hypothetical protein
MGARRGYVGIPRQEDLETQDITTLRINGTTVTADAAELNILDGVTATTAELNRVADVSGRVVTAITTLAVTELAHDGKTIVLALLAGFTSTLPAATGSGARFRFVVGIVNTTNSYIIKVTGNDVMYGNIIGNSTGDTPDLAQPWPTAADSDTVTLDGTTTGGAAIGDWIEFEDIAADKWAVRGVVTQSGTEATPFSATV